MTIPVYKPRKASCTIEPSARPALFPRTQPLTRAESEQAPFRIKLVPSLCERWLFCVVSVAALVGVVTYGVAGEVEYFLGLLLGWALLLGFGVYQLSQQKPLEWLYTSPGHFSWLGGGVCQIEGRWSLFPWLVLIQYRVSGRRWSRRLLWPDSGDTESLRRLRASLFSGPTA